MQAVEGVIRAIVDARVEGRGARGETRLEERRVGGLQGDGGVVGRDGEDRGKRKK